MILVVTIGAFRIPLTELPAVRIIMASGTLLRRRNILTHTGILVDGVTFGAVERPVRLTQRKDFRMPCGVISCRREMVPVVTIETARMLLAELSGVWISMAAGTGVDLPCIILFGWIGVTPSKRQIVGMTLLAGNICVRRF